MKRNFLSASLLPILALVGATACAQQKSAATLSEQRKKVILFDLGYVLLKPNQLKMSRYILPQTTGLSLWNFNPWNIVRLGMLYAKGLLTPLKIQTTMDAVMNHARANEPQQTAIVDQHGHAHTNIDADHHSGAKSDAALYAEIQASIANLAQADKDKPAQDRFFYNPAHRCLVQKTLEMRFAAPQFFGESFTPIKAGVELVEKCKKSGNELAILSNWGAGSFPYMQNYQPNQVIFKHFKPEHIFASGIIKKAKPHQAAYEHVLQAMNVQPADVIFIDDQLHNVEAARKMGMQAIHLTNYKDPQAYKQVEATLEQLGVNLE